MRLLLGFAILAIASLGCSSIPPGRAAVDAVEVEGAHHVSSSDVEEKIATAPSPKFLGLWSGVVFDYALFDRYVLDRDMARVERFYRARGYYEAHARAARVEYTKADHVRVTIAVEEGPPILIEHIDLAGIEGLPTDVANAARAAAASRVSVNKIFDEDDFKAAEDLIKRALTDRGYAYAKVDRHASVDLPRHKATLGFGLAPDKQARLGPIRFEGLGSIPEEPARRALDLQEGELYSTRALDNAQQALLDLGVFGSVDVQPELSDPPPEDRVVPVVVKVEPARLRGVKLGGGVELDVIKSDIHGLVGWEDSNFLGGLRRFSVEARPGGVLYPTRLPDMNKPTNVLPEGRLRTELRQPGFIEARTNGLVRGQANIYPVLLVPQVNPGDPVLGYRELHGATGADRTIWRLFTELTYNAQYLNPFMYVGPRDPDLSAIVISYVDIVNHFDFRDDKIHPTTGVYIGNDLQLAGGVLGGAAEDVRVQPEVRGYVPLAKHVVFATRGSVGLLFPASYGATLGSNNFGQPAGVSRADWIRDVQLVYLRSFFGGGTTSNRGWPLRAIGPHGVAPFYSPGLAAQQIAQECVPGTPTYDVVRCAVPLGGFTLWEASAEVRFLIASPLEGATFCDAADVSAKRVDIRFQRPHLSCGAGLRYDTPVGPIRLDVAYRIPGMQSLEQTGPGDDGDPGTILGVPIAIAFGIGESF